MWCKGGAVLALVMSCKVGAVLAFTLHCSPRSGGADSSAAAAIHRRSLPARMASSPPLTVVRDMRPSERASVGSLLCATFAPDSNPLSRAAIIGEHVLGLRERHANHVLVAVCAPDESVIGFVECYTREFLASAGAESYPERVRSLQSPYVASLAVRREMRRTGVGTALMLAVEERIRQSDPGALQVVLEVEEGDGAAIGLYEGLGYVQAGRDEHGRRLEGDVFFGRSVRVTKLEYAKTLQAQQHVEDTEPSSTQI